VRVLESPQAQALLDLGKCNGWDSFMLGQAPLPNSPVRLGKWLLAPAEADSSHIPARTLARVQAIYSAGLRPKGFVIVHEAPLELSAPKEQATSSALRLHPLLASALIGLGRGVVAVAPGVLKAVATTAAVALAAVGAATLVAIPLTLLVGAAVLDPILVAVTEDGYWVEIDRWVNKLSGVER
jgi:hypothetical protein